MTHGTNSTTSANNDSAHSDSQSGPCLRPSSDHLSYYWHTCVAKGSYEDQYWHTRAEQLHGIQSFCKALNSVSDEAFFFIGLILGAATCDGNLVCNAVIDIGNLEAGKYIRPKVGKFCNSIVSDVPKECGNKEGTTHVEVNGENYNVEAFETQENGNLCGGDSKDKCFHQTCGSEYCPRGLTAGGR